VCRGWALRHLYRRVSHELLHHPKTALHGCAMQPVSSYLIYDTKIGSTRPSSARHRQHVDLENLHKLPPNRRSGAKMPTGRRSPRTLISRPTSWVLRCGLNSSEFITQSHRAGRKPARSFFRWLLRGGPILTSTRGKFGRNRPGLLSTFQKIRAGRSFADGPRSVREFDQIRSTSMKK